MITDDSFIYLRLKDNLLEKPKRKRKKGVKPGRREGERKKQAHSSKGKERKNSQNVHFSSNSFRTIWFLNQ